MPKEVGGADRDRTDDLKLAKLPLSQLSYGPELEFWKEAVVGPDRFELSTPRLSSVCSNQLSYGPSPAAVVRKKRTPQLGSQNPRTDVRGREEKRRRRQPQMSSSSVKDAGRFLQSDREDLLEQQMSNRNRP